jgi:outer membrane protein OmpA-like peptidoglycan-associated protein
MKYKQHILISLSLLSLLIINKAEAQNRLTFQDSSNVNYAPYVAPSGKLYFQTNVSKGYSISESYIDTLSWTWPEANPIKNEQLLLGYDLAGGPSLSAKEDTMYFCAILAGGKGDMDIWYSVKQSDGKWGVAINLPGELNSDRYEGFPSVSSNGSLMFFTRHKGLDNTEAGCSDLYFSKKDAAGKWSKAQKLSISGNYGCVKAPRLLSDNKTLLFAAEYAEGKGGYDLLKAKFKNDVLDSIETLEFINTNQHEHFGSLYTNREILVYTQNTKLYQYKIPYAKWLIKEIYLSVYTTDKDSKQVVASQIILCNAKGDATILKDSSNANQPFLYTLPPYSDYQLKISAAGYKDTTVTLAYSLDPITHTQALVIPLSLKTKEYILNITDAETNIGLDVDIIITDLDLNEKVTITNAQGRDGKYAVNLREGHRYDIEVQSSQGYAYSRTQIEVPESDINSDSLELAYAGSERSASTLNMPVTPLKTGRKLELKEIYFDYNSHTLHESSLPELDRVVELMKENPDINIEISAHTDNKGSSDYNLKLSDKRAQEIVKYLVSKGIPAGKLKPKGYGATRPVATNDTEENRAKNRRVELKVISVKP